MMIQQIHLLPPERVRTLVGLSSEALADLLVVVLPTLDRHRKAVHSARPHRQRAPGAGRKHRLHPTQEVLLVLIYLRHNVAHRVVGQMFGVSADVSEALFREIVPILQEVCPANQFDAEKQWKRNVSPWQPEELDRVLIDTFAPSVPRSTGGARQKRGYSGKKKTRPTLKILVATDAPGGVLGIEAGHWRPAAGSTPFASCASPLVIRWGCSPWLPRPSSLRPLGAHPANGMKAERVPTVERDTEALMNFLFPGLSSQYALLP